MSDSNEVTDPGEPWPEFPRWCKPRRPYQFSIRSMLLLTLVVGLLLSCAVNLPAILGWAYHQWEIGEQFDQCTFEGSLFGVRITAFDARGGFMADPGAFYRYEVKRPGDWWWQEIVMTQFATEPIPRDQFRRLNDLCAYFYQNDLFAITRDGGVTWSLRGGASGGFSYPAFSPQQVGSGAYIESLTIESDGTGSLQLQNYDYVKLKPLPSQNFETSDFGMTWQEVKGKVP